MPQRWVYFPHRYVEAAHPSVLPLFDENYTAALATTLSPSTAFGIDYALSQGISTTLTPSTSLAESATHTAAISTTLVVSTTMAKAHGRPAALATTLTPSTSMGEVYGQSAALATTLSPDTSLYIGAYGNAMHTTPSVLSTVMEISARTIPISTGPTPSHSFSLMEARNLTMTAEPAAVVTTMDATVSRDIFARPNVYTDLVPVATHPNFTTHTSVSVSTTMTGTQPRAVSTTLSPSTSLAEKVSRSARLLTTLTPSTVLAKLRATFAAIATTLTPDTSIASFFVRTAAIATSLTPSHALAAIRSLAPRSLITNLSPFTRMSESHGKVAAISTSVTPSHVITWHYYFPEPISTSLTPATSMAEAATHIYNPMRTFLSPLTTMVVTSVGHSRALPTTLTPYTAFTQFQKKNTSALPTAPSPSTALAETPAYRRPLPTNPSPSTSMSVAVNRNAVMHTYLTPWHYLQWTAVINGNPVNPDITTYIRTIPEKGLFGGPLLQWLLCGPRVAPQGQPSVVTCIP